MLARVAAGRTNAEIARELYISLSTTKTHLASLMAKLRARNRVDNAVGHAEGQPVTVTLGCDESAVAVTVRDHGVGIPAEQQSQVFSRFFRASNVATSYYSYPGMGLGLFIAHSIIERHGGRIWVDSVEKDGSTFSFALPLVKNAHSKVHSSEKRNQKAEVSDRVYQTSDF